MDSGLELLRDRIREQIEEIVYSVGIECRIFCRAKDSDSLRIKIRNKGEGYYSEEGKKVSDIIGIRIVTYFSEDVEILWDYFRKCMDIVDIAETCFSEEAFSVQRKNMVCRMDAAHCELFHECKQVNEDLKLVDDSYEIQFRTVFSEGWHEIDHLLKYKCKDDWNSLPEESRTFNGIYATLETGDRALKALFDDIAHKHYINRRWQAMLRMKYKLSFKPIPLSSGIIAVLDSNKEVAKAIYRKSRKDLLMHLLNSKLRLPITFDNIVFVSNRLSVKCEEIISLEPMNISQDLDNHLRND